MKTLWHFETVVLFFFLLWVPLLQIPVNISVPIIIRRILLDVGMDSLYIFVYVINIFRYFWTFLLVLVYTL